jgi:hypothetical protein
MIKRLQLLFKDKMGEWQEEDEGFCMEHRRVYIDNCPFAADKYSECDGEQLRIPKPIDWQNPERGLDGMLKWPYQLQRLKNGTCKLYTKTYSDGAIEAPDPFTALLKALCEQEEV